MATISSLTDGGTLRADDVIPVSRITGGTLTNAKITGSNLVNVDSAKGLLKNPTTNTVSIKLQTGGGLEFNSSGELKLSPAAASSTVVVVRPSDASSTDFWVPRASVSGELKPYFQTLISAVGWASNNLTGNVTIFIDEDTTEGSGGILPGFGGPNIAASYYTQAQVDAAFGAGSGLRAGIYVHAASTSNAISGTLWWGAGLSSGSINNTTYIRPRYLRGGVWSDVRLYTDPPRNINYNVYISNNKALALGNLGTSSLNWLNLVGNGTTDNGAMYVRSMANISNSKLDIKNLNFVSRTNARDIDVMSIGNSIVYLRNITLSLLGSGHYYYSPLRVVDNATVIVQHESLTSPVTNTQTYPGYGIAFIGNKNGARDRTTATKLNHFIECINGGWLRIMDWDPFKSNTSYLSTSVIIDGDFILNGSALMTVVGGKFEQILAFINRDSRFMEDRFDYGGTNNTLRWTTTSSSTYPFYFTKLTDIRIYGWADALRRWTIDRAIDNTGTAALCIPVKINTSNLNVGIGQFITAQNIFRYDSTNANYIASLQMFEGTSSTVGGPYSYAPDVAIGTLTQIPQFTNFYSIAEAGTTRTLDCGYTVR